VMLALLRRAGHDGRLDLGLLRWRDRVSRGRLTR